MCGFAGIVTWDNRHRVHRDVLERMSARIAHRGPDGQGLWINHEEEATAERPQVGLVHRRLAIIDLDERANQPFTDGRGRWLVFNGEIYNYRELRRELEGLLPDYRWRTQSDTEVLLASYAAWGETCVEKLNGMFAFAIWDENKGELFLARDRMGQKPLYVTGAGDSGTLAFASELAAFRSLPWFDVSINPESLTHYLRYGCIAGSGGCTAYKGTIQVAVGHVVTYQRQLPIRSRGYFDPNPPVSGAQSPDVRERVRDLISRAVKWQLVTDVPLGVFLSGGIDSSIVAACARQFGEVETFSIGFDDPRYDESEYAAQVARHLGTKHHRFQVHPAAAEDLPKLAAVFGEPFGDSSALPTHYLARETRRHVKVALSGDGGDELFGGYDRYRAMRLDAVIRRIPRSFRSVLAGPMFEQLPSSHPKSVASRMRRFVATLDRPTGERYASYLRFFDDVTIEQLLPGDPLSFDQLAAIFKSYLPSRDAVQSALATDRVTYLSDDLLTKVDRCSMLHALEVRSPFMDHKLVEFAATLTTPQLLKGGPKRMLREAFASDLPAWVFKRKKMGFAVPIGEWFRSSLRPMLHDHLFAADSFAAGHFNKGVVRRLVEEHETQRVDHSQRLYALLMLELWWKTQRS
jgi:asparagine synthase (glutamine-hydrolysing)